MNPNEIDILIHFGFGSCNTRISTCVTAIYRDAGWTSTEINDCMACGQNVKQYIGATIKIFTGIITEGVVAIIYLLLYNNKK